jgi:phosphate transport system protein
MDTSRSRTGPPMGAHIVKRFEDELQQIRLRIARMGTLVRKQFDEAVEAVTRRDPALADETVEHDAQVDRLEHEVADATVRLLALRQPVAVDLREAVAAIKISSDLERIGDLAKNMAKHAHVLSRSQYTSSLGRIGRIGRIVSQQIERVVQAYMDEDAEEALAVWRYDAEIDDWFNSLFRELLTYMMEDAQTIGACTHVLFMGKNVERIGDHCANIAGTIYYLVEGMPLVERRPKGEDTAFTDVEPPSSEG